MPENKQSITIQREMRLGRRLGGGAMGDVYEGFEKKLGAHAAVKFLKSEHLSEGNDSRERFDDEALIMASLAHPGCLAIYGWGVSEEGRPYYAMQQISGKTLSDLLLERSGQSKSLVWGRRLMGYFQAVCEIVAYAHERGIVHRDLKPDNIMIDHYGSVYVIDWGLAKRMGSSDGSSSEMRTIAGMLLGTPGYMAPEQSSGEAYKAGFESDVFALGVILYEILTGHFPFGAMSVNEVLKKTMTFEPLHPIKFNALLPRSICAVSIKAISKEPTDRYAHAGLLLEDIQAFLEGRPVAAKKPNPIEKVIYWSRKRPLQAVTSGAAAVCVTSLLAVFLAQAGLDYKEANAARRQITQAKDDVAKLENQIEQNEETLSNLTGKSLEERKTEIAVLETSLFLKKLQVIGKREKLSTLRFAKHDDLANREAIEDMFRMLESGVDSQHQGLVLAIVDSLLESENKGSLLFSPKDVTKLLAIRKEAVESFESTREP